MNVLTDDDIEDLYQAYLAKRPKLGGIGRQACENGSVPAREHNKHSSLEKEGQA